MRNIISCFPKDVLEEASALFSRSKNISYSGGGNSSSKAMLLSDIFRKHKVGNVVWVVNGENYQNAAKKAAEIWGERPVFLYHRRSDEERLGFSSLAGFERAKSIESIEFAVRLYHDSNAIFVVDFESLAGNFPNVGLIQKDRFETELGAKLDIVEFIGALVDMGYEVTDEELLKKGEYYRVGDSLLVWPVNCDGPIRIDTSFDVVDDISFVGGQAYGDVLKKVGGVSVFPAEYDEEVEGLLSILGKDCLVVDDEVDVVDELYGYWNSFMEEASGHCHTLAFTSFNDDVSRHIHLHFLSVLKYRSAYDLANDLRDKISNGWNTVFFTKNLDETRGLFRDQALPYVEGLSIEKFSQTSIFLIEVDKDDAFAQSFQAPRQKVLLLNDTDISKLRGEGNKATRRNVFDDFLTSLKEGNFVVHSDHGIARFLGLDRKTVDGVTKEYLKLGYAENDKLFVPIDQADKVNKYIGSADLMPKLTRLGSAEWNTMTARVKKETQKIAKELLKLYAQRKAAKGHRFAKDNNLQEKFEETFPYEETPGQIKAINDSKADMETPFPMDRLICGDVGFGKTEVAMRATFKAVQNKKQVAIVSPITILADQHYRSFKRRMEPFHVRVEMMSRFRSQKEQGAILEKLKRGEVDVVVGTHRLLMKDVVFKDLGLVVIDEEQRFGVKQKEKLKEMRQEVDILTLTATPIPRTLNICLNKLRDITTITTPPQGRLPIITEVRKYSPSLVREAILAEVNRGGQVYFLHNRVQTIDSFAEKLRALVPEAKFGVAHGKLGAGDLEERIMSFKEGRFDVLVSSTIIENGIDLASANTLIVNMAEKFGLSQLYQLRGRVGRGKIQAYAYFLYHGQRLKLDAKKRLRAIVEASELGSGFKIAMKDLEIRGAGDILGANQHGVINVVGVSHFMRMLNKAVEDLKAGRIMDGDDEIEDVAIELPIPSYIPDSYIVDSNQKISAYQRLSSASTLGYLKELDDDFVGDYGKMPMEVSNLFKIIELKILSKASGLVGVKSETVPMSKDKEIVLYMSKRVKPGNIIGLLEYNADWQISGTRLRINVQKLGKNWLEGLKKCVKVLGKSAKLGVRK